MPQEKSQHGKRKGSASNGEPQMTKASRQAIIDSKFDFASVAGCMSDIRRSFWNLERTNEFYKKKIANLHSHFYQQIVPGRQEEREEMEKKLKRGGFISALKLIDNAKVGKEKVKSRAFESGSEGSRRGYSPDQEENQYGANETDSEVAPVEHDETVNRIIIEDHKAE